MNGCSGNETSNQSKSHLRRILSHGRKLRGARSQTISLRRTSFGKSSAANSRRSRCSTNMNTAPCRTPAFAFQNHLFASAMQVACHRDPKRWALLYRLLWRLTHGEPRLLEIVVDPDVNDFMRMEKAVATTCIRCARSFVFGLIEHDGATWHVAWFEPEHHIVELNAPFFRDRFANMRWSILTPDRCVHWDGQNFTFTKGVPKSEAPSEDATEELWRTYYGNIFNPARVKTKAMQKEMPKRYWKNLPEAEIIPVLLQEAPARVEKMLRESGARSRSRK